MAEAILDSDMEIGGETVPLEGATVGGAIAATVPPAAGPPSPHGQGVHATELGTDVGVAAPAAASAVESEPSAAALTATDGQSAHKDGNKAKRKAGSPSPAPGEQKGPLTLVEVPADLARRDEVYMVLRSADPTKSADASAKEVRNHVLRAWGNKPELLVRPVHVMLNPERKMKQTPGAPKPRAVKMVPTGVCALTRRERDGVWDKSDELQEKVMEIEASIEDAHAVLPLPRNPSARYDLLMQELEWVASVAGIGPDDCGTGGLAFIENTDKYHKDDEAFLKACAITSVHTPKDWYDTYKDINNNYQVAAKERGPLLFEPSGDGQESLELTEQGLKVMGMVMLRTPGSATVPVMMCADYMTEYMEVYISGGKVDESDFRLNGRAKQMFHAMFPMAIHVRALGREFQGSGVLKVLVQVPAVRARTASAILQRLEARSSVEPIVSQGKTDEGMVWSLSMTISAKVPEIPDKVASSPQGSIGKGKQVDQQGDKTVHAIRDELTRALAKQESAAAARDAKRAEEAEERESKHAAKLQELMDAQRASEVKIQEMAAQVQQSAASANTVALAIAAMMERMSGVGGPARIENRGGPYEQMSEDESAAMDSLWCAMRAFELQLTEWGLEECAAALRATTVRIGALRESVRQAASAEPLMPPRTRVQMLGCCSPSGQPHVYSRDEHNGVHDNEEAGSCDDVAADNDRRWIWFRIASIWRRDPPPPPPPVPPPPSRVKPELLLRPPTERAHRLGGVTTKACGDCGTRMSPDAADGRQGDSSASDAPWDSRAHVRPGRAHVRTTNARTRWGDNCPGVVGRSVNYVRWGPVHLRERRSEKTRHDVSVEAQYPAGLPVACTSQETTCNPQDRRFQAIGSSKTRRNEPTAQRCGEGLAPAAAQHGNGHEQGAHVRCGPGAAAPGARQAASEGTEAGDSAVGQAVGRPVGCHCPCDKGAGPGQGARGAGATRGVQVHRPLGAGLGGLRRRWRFGQVHREVGEGCRDGSCPSSRRTFEERSMPAGLNEAKPKRWRRDCETGGSHDGTSRANHCSRQRAERARQTDEQQETFEPGTVARRSKAYHLEARWANSSTGREATARGTALHEDCGGGTGTHTGIEDCCCRAEQRACGLTRAACSHPTADRGRRLGRSCCVHHRVDCSGRPRGRTYGTGAGTGFERAHGELPSKECTGGSQRAACPSERTEQGSAHGTHLPRCSEARRSARPSAVIHGTGAAECHHTVHGRARGDTWCRWAKDSLVRGWSWCIGSHASGRKWHGGDGAAWRDDRGGDGGRGSCRAGLELLAGTPRARTGEQRTGSTGTVATRPARATNGPVRDRRHDIDRGAGDDASPCAGLGERSGEWCGALCWEKGIEGVRRVGWSQPGQSARAAWTPSRKEQERRCRARAGSVCPRRQARRPFWRIASSLHAALGERTSARRGYARAQGPFVRRGQGPHAVSRREPYDDDDGRRACGRDGSGGHAKRDDAPRRHHLEQLHTGPHRCGPPRGWAAQEKAPECARARRLHHRFVFGGAAAAQLRRLGGGTPRPRAPLLGYEPGPAGLEQRRRGRPHACSDSCIAHAAVVHADSAGRVESEGGAVLSGTSDGPLLPSDRGFGGGTRTPLRITEVDPRPGSGLPRASGGWPIVRRSDEMGDAAHPPEQTEERAHRVHAVRHRSNCVACDAGGKEVGKEGPPDLYGRNVRHMPDVHTVGLGNAVGEVPGERTLRDGVGGAVRAREGRPVRGRRPVCALQQRASAHGQEQAENPGDAGSCGREQVYIRRVRRIGPPEGLGIRNHGSPSSARDEPVAGAHPGRAHFAENLHCACAADLAGPHVRGAVQAGQVLGCGRAQRGGAGIRRNGISTAHDARGLLDDAGDDRRGGSRSGAAAGALSEPCAFPIVRQFRGSERPLACTCVSRVMCAAFRLRASWCANMRPGGRVTRARDWDANAEPHGACGMSCVPKLVHGLGQARPVCNTAPSPRLQRAHEGTAVCARTGAVRDRTTEPDALIRQVRMRPSPARGSGMLRAFVREQGRSIATRLTDRPFPERHDRASHANGVTTHRGQTRACAEKGGHATRARIARGGWTHLHGTNMRTYGSRLAPTACGRSGCVPARQVAGNDRGRSSDCVHASSGRAGLEFISPAAEIRAEIVRAPRGEVLRHFRTARPGRDAHASHRPFVSVQPRAVMPAREGAHDGAQRMTEDCGAGDYHETRGVSTWRHQWTCHAHGRASVSQPRHVHADGGRSGGHAKGGSCSAELRLDRGESGGSEPNVGVRAEKKACGERERACRRGHARSTAGMNMPYRFTRHMSAYQGIHISHVTTTGVDRLPETAVVRPARWSPLYTQAARRAWDGHQGWPQVDFLGGRHTDKSTRAEWVLACVRHEGQGMVVTAREWKRLMRIMHGNGMAEETKVSMWNTRALHAAAAFSRGKGEAAAASRRKLAAIDQFLESAAPEVFVALEVTGSLKEFRELRRWFKKRRYTAKMTPGRHAREAEAGATPTCHNGFVLATRDGAASFAGEPALLCDRTARVDIKFGTEQGSQRLWIVHGLHDPVRGARGEVLTCWINQIEAVELDDMGTGGLTITDINRIPCTRWRIDDTGGGAKCLSCEDRNWRKFIGWTCECCGSSGQQPSTRRQVVGGSGPRDGIVALTRKRTAGNAWAAGGSRLDLGVESGADRGRWRAHAAEFQVDEAGPVSDHAIVTWSRRLAASTPCGPARPMPIRMQAGSEEAEAYFDTLEAGAARAAQVSAETAADRGESAVRAITEALRAEAEGVTSSSAVRSDAHRLGSGQRGKGDYNSWLKRLRAAREMRDNGVDVYGVSGGLLFHHATGLAKVRQRCWAENYGSDEAWAEVVCRCRNKAAKAGRVMRKEQIADDKWLIEEANALRFVPDLGAKLSKVWRMIAGRKANTKVSQVHVGDSSEGEVIHHTETGFGSALASIGRKFVKALDEGAVPAAFEAWNRMFVGKFEEIKGRDGGVWRMEKEISWELFLEVLYSMPKGKAVGAGGFSVELLLRADLGTQRAFYEAMFGDVCSGTLSDHWKAILYALLVKPAPNNPDIIGERREIALMPQDMKVFLQMIRRAAYSKVTGRIVAAQAGWCAGMGHTDPCMAVSAAISQAQRLQHDLYVLYIDLATFFPRIRRDIVQSAELLAGLPPEVLKIVALIYGEHSNHEAAVKCRYESAGGLGDEFDNWMGCLMGCVLSPDRAKILLNSVLAAINLVVRGVVLFGSSAVDRLRTWEHIAQVAFADDWCGSFESVRELRLAWEIWASWELATGSKLGVKKLLKTAVGAVRWIDGNPVELPDPKLELNGGGHVPFMGSSEFYKHLGTWKNLRGEWKDAWANGSHGLRKKFMTAIARCRTLRRPSRDELIVVSNALLGGLGGAYLQTFYISRKQADEVEGAWLKVFNAKMRTCSSSPRRLVYGSGVERGKRVHLHEVGITAAYACLTNAMADVADTPQRRAATSAVALSLAKWGCVGDPARWDWRYLAHAIERELDSAKVRHMADVWMLAIAVGEQHMSDSEDGETRRLWKRLQAEGRWQRDGGDEHPLSSTQPYFKEPESLRVFDTVENGGLGVEASAIMLHAGLMAVGNFCDHPLKKDGKPVFRWAASFETWAAKHPQVSKTARARKEWERVMTALTKAGAQPCRPEECRVFERPPEVLARARPPCPAQEGGTSALRKQLRAERRSEAEGNVHEMSGTAEWGARLRDTFGELEPPEAVEFNTGVATQEARARGAHIVTITNSERIAVRRGGEQRWLRQRDDGFELDEDGYVVGWLDKFNQLRQTFPMDDEGWVCWPTGDRIRSEDADDLPPAVQIFVRARHALSEAPIINSADMPKVTRQHVNAYTSDYSFGEVLMWCCRFEITDIFSLDASFQVAKDDKGFPQRDAYGDPMKVGGRAAVHHTGAVSGGHLSEREGNNNYIGEAAAHVDAHSATPPDARVLIIFDATSPVEANSRFGRVHDRKKQNFNIDMIHDTWSRLRDSSEVTVQLWRPSHTGDVVNEWADSEADKFAVSDSVPKLIQRLRPSHTAFHMNAHVRGARHWCASHVRPMVLRDIVAASRDTQYIEETDLTLGKFSDQQEETMAGVRSARLLIGDPKRYLGWMARSVAGCLGCPFGCTDNDGDPREFTLEHVCLECEGSEIVAARDTWREQILALRGDMQRKTQHFQLEHITEMIETGKWRRSAQPDSDQWLRRVVGGLIQQSADNKVDRDPRTKARARAAIAASCEMLQVACRAQADSVKQIREAVRVAGIQLKMVKKWRERVLWGGPLRASRLAEIDQGRGRAQHILARMANEGELSGAQMRAALQRLQRKVTSLTCTVRAETNADRTRAALEGEAEARAWITREWMLVHLVRRWRVRHAKAYGAGQRQGDDFIASLITTNAASFFGWCSVPYAATRLESFWIAPSARVAGLDESRARAWSAVLNLGGLTALRRLDHRAVRDSKRARAVDTQMAKFMLWWLDSDASSGDAGQRPIPSGEGALHIVIGRPSAKMAKKRRAVAARAAAMRPLHLGLEGDRCNRWAVDELLDGRVVGRARQVHVKWCGSDSDGEPWPTCWVSWTALTRDLKQLAENFFPKRDRAAGRTATRTPARAGTRRSARVADRETRAGDSGESVGRSRSRDETSDSSEGEQVLGDAGCDSSADTDPEAPDPKVQYGTDPGVQGAAGAAQRDNDAATAAPDRAVRHPRVRDDGRFHKIDRLIQTVRRQGRVRVQVRWQDARTVAERSVSWVPIGYLSDDMKKRAWVMLTGRAACGVATRSNGNKQQSVQKTAKAEVPRMQPPDRAPLQRGCKRQCVCYAENARQADMS